MLIPSCPISVACHDPCSQTAIGKNVGSVAVGIPRDQPAYGLIQAMVGTVGTQALAAPPVPVAPPPRPLAPPRPEGKASPDGERATAAYKNVQVLTDLSVDQFNTLMAAMTTWVAPQQGCAYCHNVENLADDSVYAKKVARRMIQMTRHINQD